jgi:hypothetical protein
MKNRAAVSALISSCLLGCGPSARRPAETESTTSLNKYPNNEFNNSIVRLLANPDRYDGKRIRIEGYLRVAFEGTAIYLSKDDADYAISSNGFWVDFDKDEIADDVAAKFDGKYVLIEGRFNKDNRGHMSAWQGSVEHVNRVLAKTRND